MIQVSPHEAVSNLSQWINFFGLDSPSFLMPKSVDTIASAILFGISAISLIYLLYSVLKNKLKRSSHKIEKNSPEPSEEIIEEDEYILLDVAARILYEKTEGTEFNKQLSANYGDGAAHEQIMQRFTYSLMTGCKLYGKTPLSSILRPIELDGGLRPRSKNILSRQYDNTPVYIDVCVEKKNLDEYVNEKAAPEDTKGGYSSKG